MSDYIKREDALQCLRAIKSRLKSVEDSIWDAVAELNDLANAADVVERKVGRWEDGVSFYLRCSECGCCLKQPSEYNEVFLDIGMANYCPNCGADMRGGE